MFFFRNARKKTIWHDFISSAELTGLTTNRWAPMTFPATMVFKTLRNSSSAGRLLRSPTGEGPSGKTWRGHSASFAKLKRYAALTWSYRRILLLPPGPEAEAPQVGSARRERPNPQSGPAAAAATASIPSLPENCMLSLQNLPVSLIRKVLPVLLNGIFWVLGLAGVEIRLVEDVVNAGG